VGVQRAKVQRLPIGMSEHTSYRTGAVMKILEVPERGAGGVLKIERVFQSGKRWVPHHVHLDFAERFTIVRGVADAKIGSSEVRLAEGAVHYVPLGAEHTNPINRTRYELAYEQTFEPATEGALSYVRTLAQVLDDGRDDDGDLPWPLVLAIGAVTRERTYVGRRAYSLQRRVLLPLGNYVAGTRNLGVQLARVPNPRD
jgi:mannose-6-phosphate isomerase-like protein (cupin superfamily)